jgi:UDPglucose 6-dehydrogenase
MQIVGSDDRVDSSMLMPGGPWGGPCFPKDVEALSHETDTHHEQDLLIDSIIKSNERHVAYIVENVWAAYEPSRIGLVGVGFKAGSTNMTNSLALRMEEMFESFDVNTVMYDENVDDLADPEGNAVDVAVICSPQSSIDFDCPVVDVWNSEADASQLF